MDVAETYRTDLDVGDGHVLHVRTYGNERGTPAVYLHGGPGSGCQPGHARLFDPARFRIVLFDQRGAGRSRPKRGLAANTTAHLVADLERVRTHLEIDRWMVVGGSWGSTLGLAYAEAFPERVCAMVLRAVFLGTRGECEWAFRGAAETFRPELWSAFRDLLPESERDDPIRAYGRRLEAPEPKIHRPAADAWAVYEGTLSTLSPPQAAFPERLDHGPRRDDGRGPNTPYVEWHYIKNDFFMEPNRLLDHAHRLQGIPGRIVQGRYDLLCPPATAAAVAGAWSDSELAIVPGTGHAGTEPAIQQAVIAAIRDLAEVIGATR